MAVGAIIIVSLILVGIVILVAVTMIITDKKENGKRKRGPIALLISMLTLLGLFFGGLKIMDVVNTSGHGVDNRDGNPFILTMSVVDSDIPVKEHKFPSEALMSDTFIIRARMDVKNVRLKVEFYIGAKESGTLLDTAEVKVGNLKNGEEFGFVVPHTDVKCLMITSYKINVIQGTTSFLDWFVDPK